MTTDMKNKVRTIKITDSVHARLSKLKGEYRVTFSAAIEIALNTMESHRDWFEELQKPKEVKNDIPMPKPKV